jgi:hypothetical protein
MIAQILNRDTVLDQLGRVKSQLASDVENQREGGTAAGTEHLTSDDYEEALAWLENAARTERLASTGQSSFPPQPSERRDAPIAPLDDFSFFSRDPVMSNLQSTLDAYWQRSAEDRPLPDDDRRAVPGRRGVVEEVAVTTQSIPGAAPQRHAGRRVFNRFSITDPGWVSSAFAAGVRLFRKRKKFNASPPSPIELGTRVRLVLVGDWGSGLPRAQKVAAQMRVRIEEGVQQGRDVHVAHLGDVYYSGWSGEYTNRFLKYWPVRPDEADRISSWNLNGNHDMYSGGHAYYDVLNTDRRFRKQAGCSYFSLFNQSWRILGLDTAWDDNGLKDPQGQWAAGLAQTDDKKLLLLSHHQLFSAYEDVGDVLPEKLKPVLATDRVKAWFWGHEHRCMLYTAAQGVGFARCIGHGGVPVYMSHKEQDPYPPPGEYEYRDFLQKGLEKWALFGFAVVDLEESTARVTYIDENGQPHKSESFVA